MVNGEDDEQRISRAEQEVTFLREEIERLRLAMSSNANSSTAAADSSDPLLAENAKLKYRLNILKRAAGEGGDAASSSAPKRSSSADNAMYCILSTLTEIFGTAIRASHSHIEDVPVLITQANHIAAKSGVDYQCNSVMTIMQKLKAKGVKANPSEIGKLIVAALPAHPIVDSVEVAPNGFINIRLSKEEGRRLLQLLLQHGVQPPPIIPRKKRVVVDFSSPNIAKEMHVGHLRSTIIGDSICRLLEFLEQDVLRINHVGDWGTQFGMLIAHLQDEYPNYREVSPSVSDLQAFYKASKKRFDEDAEFKQRAYACVVKLQGGEPEYINAWQLICDASRKEFQKVYDRLGVKLEERGESFYQKRMEVLVRELEEKGLLVEDEGRKILWADDVSVPFTVVKSDGGFTYDTSDMATIRQRLDEEKADWLIYVTDQGQSQHFEILEKIALKLGWLEPSRVRYDHVSFGVVLGEDKKKFKTRSGETVRLVDLLDEGLRRALSKLKEKEREKVLTAEELLAAQKSVAYGCIKYADLLHNRTLAYVFSFDRMLDDKGNTAVYLLYALTRIRSIARTAGVSPEQLQTASTTTQISVHHEKEWKLAKTIMRFAEVLSNVTSTLCLHPLCEFVYEVAVTFSDFYTTCYCLEKNDQGEIVKVNMDRLLLVEVTARMLEKCFYILGLEPVAKM